MFFFEHHGMKSSEPFHFFKLAINSFPAHLHRAYEIILVESGCMQLNVEKNEYILNANDAAFIFTNQLHSFSSLEDSKVHIMIFSPELVGSFYSDTKSSIPENNVIHLTEMPKFELLDTYYGRKSLLYSFCDQLIRSTRLVPVDTSSKMIVFQQILAYVDTHYYDASCSLKTVAAVLQYDYAYLSKLFSNLAKTSFTQYLNHYRISQACYLIKSSQFSISEISERCGYQNLRTFHRNFLNIQKCSPTAYQSETVTNINASFTP